MKIIENIKLDYSDVLIVPKRSALVSRKQVSLIRNYTFLNSGAGYTGVPIISSNMDQTGTFEMALTLNKFDVSTAIHKHYSEQELVEYYKKYGSSTSFYSMGIGDNDYTKFKNVYKQCKIENVCLDVANGYTLQFEKFVSNVREEYPEITIMAGSVVTPEMTEQLLLAGADIIRVGVGSGSVCITRKVAGIGYPQLSAVIECADAAHGLKGHIVADGGCCMPGDVAKAFGAGADFVMLGGMMAGHEECGGEKIYDANGIVTHMKFYGMSSSQAMEKYSGGVAEYRASEGKEVVIDYRGTVDNTIKEILGGVRSCCTYVGAKTLKELSKRTTFIKVNNTHNKVFGDEK